MLVYTPHITPRFQYIVETLFASCGISDYKIETNKEIFIAYKGCKTNYSHERLADTTWIKPHTLLFENKIAAQQIECFEWMGLKAFFRTGGDIPFDIFAASFYLISRYEEYLPHEKDMYGRYAHNNSLAYKENFLQLPLVNLWMKELISQFPMLKAQSSKLKAESSFLPTYDIDIAYSYLNHSLKDSVGGIFRAIVIGQWSTVKERILVLIKRKSDPFDVYQWLDELHKKYELKPLYFFLLAEKRRGYDKNISPRNKAMQQLIKQEASKYQAAIHPSWQSGDDETKLSNEIGLLKTTTGEQVSHSRQHYIRMHFPETYHLLLKNQVTNDYSMGYGSINGFRASFASPFYWYDLDKEEKTILLVHPFCYMEANSFFEQHYSAPQAAEELQQYYDVVRSVNGTLITIFHNHFLTGQKQWLPWRKMYADFLENNFG